MVDLTVAQDPGSFGSSGAENQSGSFFNGEIHEFLHFILSEVAAGKNGVINEWESAFQVFLCKIIGKIEGNDRSVFF